MANGDSEPLQLRDMNARDLPRERLMRLGRSALSDEELIAIFLRTGLHGCNVLELAAQLKRTAGGSLAALGRLDGAELARLCKGIGAAKAATLAAVFELGQRAVRERLEQTKLESPETVYEMLAGELRYEPVENLILLLLDVRRHLLRRVHLGRGTLTQVITHPRNVFREALLANASAFIMVHNHPSGDPTPSKADEKLTSAIAQAGEVMGIRLMDHIIIGAPRGDQAAYYSFRQHSRLP